MPRNGSGVYTSAKNWTAGETLTETDLDNFVADLETALTASIAKDGQTTPTANLPMGGFKHTSVANATGRTQYASARQFQDCDLIYGGTAAGTATALTCSLTPAITALATPQLVVVKAASNSSGASTLSVNGTTATTIKRSGRDIRSGDWLTGDLLGVLYDGTNWQLLFPGRAMFRGARVYQSAAQSIPASTLTTVTWSTESFDTDAIHDTGSNTERLTVPTGVSYVSLNLVGVWGSDNTGTQRYATIDSSAVGSVATVRAARVGTTEFTVSSGPIAVSAADYFVVKVFQDTAGAVDFGGAGTAFFSMTILS